jgi:hypothetical protein
VRRCITIGELHRILIGQAPPHTVGPIAQQLYPPCPSPFSSRERCRPLGHSLSPSSLSLSRQSDREGNQSCSRQFEECHRHGRRRRPVPPHTPRGRPPRPSTGGGRCRPTLCGRGRRRPTRRGGDCRVPAREEEEAGAARHAAGAGRRIPAREEAGAASHAAGEAAMSQQGRRRRQAAAAPHAAGEGRCVPSRKEEAACVGTPAMPSTVGNTDPAKHAEAPVCSAGNRSPTSVISMLQLRGDATTTEHPSRRCSAGGRSPPTSARTAPSSTEQRDRCRRARGEGHRRAYCGVCAESGGLLLPEFFLSNLY